MVIFHSFLYVYQRVIATTWYDGLVGFHGIKLNVMGVSWLLNDGLLDCSGKYTIQWWKVSGSIGIHIPYEMRSPAELRIFSFPHQTVLMEVSWVFEMILR